MVGLIRWGLGAIPLVLIVFLTLFPILWTFLSSFKTLRDIVTPVPKLFFTPTLANYAQVLATPSVQAGLINSATIVSSAVATGMVFGIPAAHVLARYPIKLKADIQFFVLSLRPLRSPSPSSPSILTSASTTRGSRSSSHIP